MFTKNKKKTVKKRDNPNHFFNFNRNKTQKTTVQQLNELEKFTKKIRLGKLEEFMKLEHKKLELSNTECKQKCKHTCAEKYKNDPQICNQLNDLIDTKSFYEANTVCSNTFHVSECKSHLESYKKMEFITNYVKVLSNKCDQLFSQYKDKIKPPPTKPMTPQKNTHKPSSYVTSPKLIL